MGLLTLILAVLPQHTPPKISFESYLGILVLNRPGLATSGTTTQFLEFGWRVQKLTLHSEEVAS